MNFSKKRNIVIQFISNAKDGLFRLIGIPCFIFVPYLYASALGYKANVLPDVVAVWMKGFLLIMGCAVAPTILLDVIITKILMNVKVAKITCKLPLTEKEMDEFAKNKTCEEIIMDIEKFLTYVVWGEEYHFYDNPKQLKLLKSFYSYIKDNYTNEEIGTASELAKKIQYMD